MNCNIITDLLPLYIDGCCSDESVREIESHLNHCENCKKVFDNMNTVTETVEKTSAKPKKINRLGEWKASMLQSVLMFISFGVITVGVAMEADTPSGLLNGFWAFSLVVPATAFMLSLANWYFVRLYKNKSVFSTVSCIVTLAVTVIGYLWSLNHYDGTFTVDWLLGYARVGAVLSVLFCIFSKMLSYRYAKMLGKE